MKKVFIGLAFVVICLVVLGTNAEKLAQWYLFPQSTFSEDTPPQPPNYSDTSFWYAHLDFADTSDLIPPNADISQDLASKPVDIFFVHSTGYVGPGGWNSNMAKENSEAQSLEYMLSSMASAFNGCCRIYAPFYRQAHIASFVNDDLDSSYAALDLAYSDVETAFDYFIAHQNQGRPFMIVGHSQGSLHATRLLANRVEHTALQQRLVAAYTIGYWLSLDVFERTFSSISLCTFADQTGCIVSFDSYGEGGAMSEARRRWYPSGWEESELSKIACVNPLSWEANTQRASAVMHLGAFPVVFKREIIHMFTAKNPGFVFAELPELSANLTWAECSENGELFLAEQQDNPFSNHLNAPKKSYHLLDFSLFYGNIRANAITRSNAFLSSKDTKIAR